MTSWAMTTLKLVLVAACLAASTSASTAPRAASGTEALEDEIRRIATPIGGKVGVAAWRLDGHGPRVLVHADESFPMASTFKIAVAGAVLAKVDAGALALDHLLPVDAALYVESDGIADTLIHPGVSLSVHNLLELMLTRSDNTATDVLTTAAGGPEAVTAWVRGQGVRDLRVDRDTAGLLRDFFDLPPGPFSETLAMARKADAKFDERGLHPNPAFDDDPRDTSTPVATAELLTRICTGRALSKNSTAILIAIMERNRTGSHRLKARLPEGTIVAEKTGTIGGSVNDVGVIALPDGKGQVVVAVFIKRSDRLLAARERAIADIGRAVHDFYLFRTPE